MGSSTPPASRFKSIKIEFVNGAEEDTRNAKWVFKLSGLYSFGWGVNGSAFFNARQGFPFLRDIRSPTRTGGVGQTNVKCEKDGTTRYPNFYMLDARVEKSFMIRTVRLTASMDVLRTDATSRRPERGARSCPGGREGPLSPAGSLQTVLPEQPAASNRCLITYRRAARLPADRACWRILSKELNGDLIERPKGNRELMEGRRKRRSRDRRIQLCKGRCHSSKRESRWRATPKATCQTPGSCEVQECLYQKLISKRWSVGSTGSRDRSVVSGA